MTDFLNLTSNSDILHQNVNQGKYVSYYYRYYRELRQDLSK